MSAITAFVAGVLGALQDALKHGDQGATAVEYAIMVSLIAAVIVLAVGAFGLSVSGLFQSFLTGMGWV